MVIAAFCAQAASGFLLFAAEASHVALNPVFQLKVAFIAAGLLNAGIFKLTAKRVLQTLPVGAPMPARVRLVGFLSLAVWISVAALGRTIAYF